MATTGQAGVLIGDKPTFAGTGPSVADGTFTDTDGDNVYDDVEMMGWWVTVYLLDGGRDRRVTSDPGDRRCCRTIGQRERATPTTGDGRERDASRPIRVDSDGDLLSDYDGGRSSPMRHRRRRHRDATEVSSSAPTRCWRTPTATASTTTRDLRHGRDPGPRPADRPRNRQRAAPSRQAVPTSTWTLSSPSSSSGRRSARRRAAASSPPTRPTTIDGFVEEATLYQVDGCTFNSDWWITGHVGAAEHHRPGRRHLRHGCHGGVRAPGEKRDQQGRRSRATSSGRRIAVEADQPDRGVHAVEPRADDRTTDPEDSRLLIGGDRHSRITALAGSRPGFTSGGRAGAIIFSRMCFGRSRISCARRANFVTASPTSTW